MTSPDESLIKEYIEGSPKAHALVNRWIRGVVDNRHWGLSHLRDDIIQEVHRRLFENLAGGLFGARSSVKTYAIQIAKYTCIEFLRQKVRARLIDLDSVELYDPSPGPERRLAASEWTDQAAAVVAVLPPGCRQLFDMIFEENLPYQEIAKRLGIAEGTVKSRAWRCRENLLKMLKTKGLSLPT